MRDDLFPHCRTKRQKLFFLGYMARTLIATSVGWKKCTDRDSYLNKRVDLTGTLMNNLFRNYYNKMVKEMQKHIIREINNGSSRSNEKYEMILNINNIYKIIRPPIIENGINRALATGDFSVKQMNNNSSKVGIAQVLNRLTYISSVSHLRRVNTPIEKSGELIPPRKLHPTSKDFICCVETPEGQSIGVVKNISYMAHITIPSHKGGINEMIRDVILKQKDNNIEGTLFECDDDTTTAGGGGGSHHFKENSSSSSSSPFSSQVKIIVNGCWVGMTSTGMEFYLDMKKKKCSGIINVYSSVVFDIPNLEVRICNDGGRLTRPLLRVADGNHLLLTPEILQKVKDKELDWSDLMTECKLGESVIEYMDAEEQNYAKIYLEKNRGGGGGGGGECEHYYYSHAEIHPSTMFGVMASCIPFPEHNQAPRNTYQCAMGKQAVGIYALNHDKRMDKTAYIMSYPSRALVETRIMDLLKLNRIPSGTEVIVAIMSHTGYNQEDSILINKASIERGLFMLTMKTTVKDEARSLQNDDIIRCRPREAVTKGIKFANYAKLQENGFMAEDEFVENRDVIIGKVVPIKENKNDPTKKIKFDDHSISFRTNNEECYISKNITGRNGDGYYFAKVCIRTLRKVVIGDKFSSRSGQKGTCGNIIPECDMPFTQGGVIPDIILNPHAIPSRMTIAQLKETLLGKVLLELGLFGDGTSFGDLEICDIARMLQDVGYESYGNELMYNAMTGEQMASSIFIGPVFYQRLKHMVKDKQHSRSIGPMVNLTRQPAEGRCRDGGFRIGEMERDVMIAHGISHFCRERMYEASDKFSTFVCKSCGVIAAFHDHEYRQQEHHHQQQQPQPQQQHQSMTAEEIVTHRCKMCENTTDFAFVEIPYCYKLLAQELQCINIVPRMITE